ncbi:MAG: C-GCAxxG-C-C family protein [Leptolinea sp.]
MNHCEKAKDFYDRGFGCCQSVLCAFSEDFGLDTTTALKLATGFGSGMGRMGDVCGALTGGFMALGLKYGKVNTDESKYCPATEITYAKVAELARRFRERNETMHCRDLTGLDLNKPEARVYAREHNIFSGRCSQYVQDVVEILEELLADPVPTE